MRQVPAHRLLFCSTLEGKVSIVRQLEPELHIDGDPGTVRPRSWAPSRRGSLACSGGQGLGFIASALTALVGARSEHLTTLLPVPSLLTACLRMANASPLYCSVTEHQHTEMCRVKLPNAAGEATALLQL